MTDFYAQLRRTLREQNMLSEAARLMRARPHPTLRTTAAPAHVRGGA